MKLISISTSKRVKSLPTCWGDSGSYTSLNTEFGKLKPQEIFGNQDDDDEVKVSTSYVVVVHFEEIKHEAGRDRE